MWVNSMHPEVIVWRLSLSLNCIALFLNYVCFFTPVVSLHTQSAAPLPPLLVPSCCCGLVHTRAPACLGPSWMDALCDPFCVPPVLSRSHSLSNRIIRATAVSDQPQLIIQERTNLNQCTLHNLSSLDSPAAAIVMGGGADMCCSSYVQGVIV